MDKYNNIVIKEKTSKTNIIIIIISIIVLIAGGIGIWWFLNQEANEGAETTPEIIEQQVDTDERLIESNNAVVYNGVQDRTAVELLRELYGSTVEFELNPDGTETVRAINGIVSDENHKWELFVNGELYEKDPNLYVTTDTDLLEWKLNKAEKSANNQIVAQ